MARPAAPVILPFPSRPVVSQLDGFTAKFLVSGADSPLEAATAVKEALRRGNRPPPSKLRVTEMSGGSYAYEVDAEF